MHRDGANKEDNVVRHGPLFLPSGGDTRDGFIESTDVTVNAEVWQTNPASKLYKGEFRGTKVVVKEFSSMLRPLEKRMLRNEAKSLVALSHKNVVKFFGIITSTSAIVTEYLEKTIVVDEEEISVNDVRSLLDNVENNLLFSDRVDIALQSAEGLQYLHDNKILHNDVKAANFFVGQPGTKDKYIVKIGDFGEAISICKTRTRATSVSQHLTNNSKSHQRQCAGTIPFMAPELFKKGKHQSKKSDIYSFGMYIIELLHPLRSHPWADDVSLPDAIPSIVLKGERPSVRDNRYNGLDFEMCETLLRLAKLCYEENINARPDIHYIVTELVSSSHTSKNIPNTSKKGNESEREFNIENWLRKDSTDSVAAVIIPLDTHQGSVTEIAGEVSIHVAQANKGSMPGDLEDDILKAVSNYDGTNACQFYSATIAASVSERIIDIVKDESRRLQLKEHVQNILVLVPEKINSKRNIGNLYALDEVMPILLEAGLLKRRFDNQECLTCSKNICSSEGKQELKDGLKKMYRSMPCVGVYTCPPIAFSIICTHSSETDNCHFVIIDTHRVDNSVGGNQCGIILVIDLKEHQVNDAINKLVEWIEARIKTSVMNGDVQSLVLLIPTMASSTHDPTYDLQKGEDFDILDIDLENIEWGDDFVIKDEMEDTIITKMNNDTSKLGKCKEPKGNESEGKATISKEMEMIFKGYATELGIVELKNFQLKALHAFTQKQDSIIIQATSSGKSICFQVPALMLKPGNFVLVISPTISLMESQVHNMNKHNIPAIFLGPASSSSITVSDLQKMQDASEEDVSQLPRLVYMTPEYLMGTERSSKQGALSALSSMFLQIGLIVIDECHKVFDRSGDFR